jgi:hypothetical protein
MGKPLVLLLKFDALTSALWNGKELVAVTRAAPRSNKGNIFAEDNFRKNRLEVFCISFVLTFLRLLRPDLWLTLSPLGLILLFRLVLLASYSKLATIISKPSPRRMRIRITLGLSK